MTWQPEGPFCADAVLLCPSGYGPGGLHVRYLQVSSGTLYARLLEFCYHVTTTDQNGNQTTITVCEPVTCSAGAGASGCRGDSGVRDGKRDFRAGADVNYTHVGPHQRAVGSILRRPPELVLRRVERQRGVGHGQDQGAR